MASTTATDVVHIDAAGIGSSTGLGLAEFHSTTGIQLGARYNGTDYRLGGDMGEVCVFNADLTTTIGDIESYFKAKWATP
jgi:hypothetical protein